MADTPTLIGAIGAGAAAVASAITTVYKSIDIESKIAKLGERLSSAEERIKLLESLPTTLAETRAFVQQHVDAFQRRLARVESRTGSQPSIGVIDTVSALAERVAVVESWIRDKDEEANAADRRAEREKMATVLEALTRLAGTLPKGKSHG